MKNNLSAIKLIEREAAKMRGVISLAQGMPTFNSGSPSREEVVRSIRHNLVDRYSPVSGLEKLRFVIAQDLAKAGTDFKAHEEILITAGAIEALSATIIGLVKPGDEVVFPSPAYLAWFKIVQMVGAKVRVAGLNEKLDWQLDLNGLEKMVTRKTRLLILGSPNNPTGNVYSKSQILEILMMAKTWGFGSGPWFWTGRKRSRPPLFWSPRGRHQRGSEKIWAVFVQR